MAVSILFVDDDPMVLRAYQMMFADRLDVTTARCADDAMTLLQRAPPDVLVCDLDLRDQVRDGVWLLRRAEHIAPKTRRVLTTAITEHDAALGQLSKCNYRFLPKPFDRRQLMALARERRSSRDSPRLAGLELDSGTDERLVHHLLRSSTVSSAQVKAARERRRVTQIPLGRLAIETEALTPKQVFTILRSQVGTRRKFGQIAVDMGFLRRPEVERLLSLQRARLVCVVRTLVDLGHVDADIALAHLGRVRGGLGETG